MVPVKVCGDTSAEANETFSLHLRTRRTRRSPMSQGIGTIVNDDVLQLLLEESSPNVNQIAALDALLFVRDPFKVVSVPEAFAFGTDRNTRVALFVKNLELNPGESPTNVIVRLVGSNNQIFQLQAEDVRSVPNQEFTQVVFRLPNTLPAGTTMVVVAAHTRLSNVGTFQIAP
jgi:hypothetical protein